jgi:Flp pilus assembly protein TadB
MQAALEKFKKERPEEFQEYKRYIMDIRLIRIWMISLVLGAICLVIASYVWMNIIWCIAIFLASVTGLVIIFKRLKHKLHVTKLCIALMKMTFQEPSEVSTTLQDELKDIFKSKE